VNMHAGEHSYMPAFASVLRGKVLHQLVALASYKQPLLPQGHSTDSMGRVPELGDGVVRQQCSELAAALLHAAALSKRLGLWTDVDGYLCSAQPALQASTCVPRWMRCSATMPDRSQSVELQLAAPSSAFDHEILHATPFQSAAGYSCHTSGSPEDPESSIHRADHLLTDDDILSGLYCECQLQCRAARLMHPRKALQGVQNSMHYIKQCCISCLVCLHLVALTPHEAGYAGYAITSSCGVLLAT
jgi:hypothetical protein